MMKKPIIILLLILSTLSIAYAIHEGQKAENCKLMAAKKEVAQNERIRQLEDSLARAYRQLEVEKRNTLEAKKITETLAIQAEKRLEKAK